MCGIGGIVGSAITAADRACVATMCDTIRHRGPDDSGSWTSNDDLAALGHRRLSILDLSPAGHQPMLDPSGDTAIVLNGEIYNYVELRVELRERGHAFRSGSDTEVLLAAYRQWGLDCFARLNGMFAVAIYDGRTRRLVMARDRAGEKPLFYYHADSKLVFASELKAILHDALIPRVLDPEALNSYLAYGYVAGDRCMLRGFRKLQQGHVAVFDVDSNRLQTWPYWQLPAAAEPPPGDVAELTEELERLLFSAVSLQLRSDVPVGILLSGGVDSSLVTAMAAKASSRPVHTFTISFPEHGQFDEAPHAKLVADHFGTRHTVLEAEPSTVELLPLLARQYDEPIADSSMVPTFLVSRLIRQHATVALGGDGGDELFGGYLHHRWVLQHEWIERHAFGLARPLAAVATRMTPLGVRGRNYLAGLSRNRAWSIARTNLFFDASFRQRLSPIVARWCGANLDAPEAYKQQLCLFAATTLQQTTAVDFMTYLVDDILVKVDRASMLSALEVRAPWLDHRIIEFAFSKFCRSSSHGACCLRGSTWKGSADSPCRFGVGFAGCGDHT